MRFPLSLLVMALLATAACGTAVLLSVTPAAGQPQATTLTYTPWSSYSPEPSAATLSATVQCEALEKGWLIHLTVDVPPSPKKP
jgi:hypothetical protein